MCACCRCLYLVNRPRRCHIIYYIRLAQGRGPRGGLPLRSKNTKTQKNENQENTPPPAGPPQARPAEAASARSQVPQAQPAVRRRRPKSEVGPRRQAERGPGAGPPQAPHRRDRWTPTPLFQGGLVDKNRLSALGAGPLLAPAGATNERAPPCSPSPTSPPAKSPRPSVCACFRVC